MPAIFWTGYQEKHIAERHGVTAEDFEEAWNDREDYAEGSHPGHGPFVERVGCTEDGRVVEMIWRWQDGDVWPITACFVDEEDGRASEA